jgi:hypothetical protein
MGFREEQAVGCSIGIANKIIADSAKSFLNARASLGANRHESCL